MISEGLEVFKIGGKGVICHPESREGEWRKQQSPPLEIN